MIQLDTQSAVVSGSMHMTVHALLASAEVAWVL